MILKGAVAQVQSRNQSKLVPSETTIRIPGANLLGDLVNFPVRVDLSHMPPSFWATVSADGKVAGEPGWLNLAGTGSASARGVRKLTEWIMGASVIPRNTSNNGAILSYGPWESATGNRSSLVLRGSSQYGIWNSTNSWLNAPAPNAQLLVRERLHHSQFGTNGRAIWRNGQKVGNATTAAQRPGGAGDVLFIGAENLAYGERINGSINYAYLREGSLSEAWIDAEYKSWELGTLYEVVST